jgi:polysaccharide pyruvyl transferase WcaK-like protein
MTISRFTPPLDYLQAASRASLQSFELTRLNHAANLRQEIATLIDQWIQETSEAMLARWMLDHHKTLQSSPISPAELVRTLVDPAANLFPESQSPMSDMLPAPPRFSDQRPPMKGSIARKPQKQRQSATG